MQDEQIVAVESIQLNGEWRTTGYADGGFTFVIPGDRTDARVQADRSGLVAVREDFDHYRWEREDYFKLS